MSKRSYDPDYSGDEMLVQAAIAVVVIVAVGIAVILWLRGGF